MDKRIREQRSCRERTQHHPKTPMEVPVVRIVPVAVSRARVVLIVVPRTAAQHVNPGDQFDPRPIDTPSLSQI